MPARKNQPRRDGLGVDTVGAAHDRYVLVLDRSPLERGQQDVDAFENFGESQGTLHTGRRVEHVTGGHAQVQPAGRLPCEFFYVG